MAGQSAACIEVTPGCVRGGQSGALAVRYSGIGYSASSNETCEWFEGVREGEREEGCSYGVAIFGQAVQYWAILCGT